VILDVRPDGSVEFMKRASTNGSTTFLASASQPFPTWLKLARSGNTVTGSVSANGSTWTTVGTTTVSMSTSATIGLAVTSHNTSALNTSTFDNVTVSTGGGSPPPPPAGDVVIYAGDIPASALRGAWATAQDSTSPNGIKLITPDNGVANTNNPLASPADFVDVTFNAEANTPYRIWLRLQANGNSKSNDSLWVQFSDARVNGAAVYPINTTSGLLVNLATDSTGSSLSGWGWQNTAYWLSQATTITFPTTGTHTLRIQVREDGVQFDQIVLSPATFLSSAPGPVRNDSTIVPKP
jgi:Gylcosyl hydrolase family 115 C-terminal domain